MSKKYNVAVVGANGAVGEEILRVLEELDFPIKKLVPLASSRSAGNRVEFNSKQVMIKELTSDIFEKEEIEIALFSAGGSVSAKYAEDAEELVRWLLTTLLTLEWILMFLWLSQKSTQATLQSGE